MRQRLLSIPTEVIRISDAASDQQVQAWYEALEFPWGQLDPSRESETSAFLEMPYQSSPEGDFEFDASTGTITGEMYRRSRGCGRTAYHRQQAGTCDRLSRI